MVAMAVERQLEKRSSVQAMLVCKQHEQRLEQLKADPVVTKIMATDAFKRLSDVSFLGALDYIGLNCQLSKSHRSRADHSLGVAALADYVAQQRGYSKDLRRHLTVAGLLHDIGHPPLSHSIEPYLKKVFGYGHHEMGDMLLSGENHIGRQLKNVLAQEVGLDFIKSLIAGEAADSDGGDLFSSPINIDTIEGIIRSSYYLENSPVSLDPFQVASASFLDSSESRYSMLDAFWRQKDFVYKELINCDVGLLSDLLSQVYFENKNGFLKKSDLFNGEGRWRIKFRNLFTSLKEVKNQGNSLKILCNDFISYQARDYKIDSSKFGLERYQFIKYQSFKELSFSK